MNKGAQGRTRIFFCNCRKTLLKFYILVSPLSKKKMEQCKGDYEAPSFCDSTKGEKCGGINETKYQRKKRESYRNIKKKKKSDMLIS